MTSTELAPIATTEPPQGDLPLVARLAAEPRQRDVITFTLEVVNTSTATITLANPYDGVTYTLTDGEGWPIGLRAPGRSVKVDGPKRRPRAQKASYLAVRAISVADAEVDTADGVEADTTDLAPASSYRLTLEIASRAASEGDEPQPLTPGTYHLSILLPLTWTVGGDESDLTVASEEITVTLTG